ncbi:N(6)-adenine-specific methyltransferase METTL4-like [Ylistrum balloti]|uniref:N(6)-adenine-specific methyltransferase METTL4-like n=1 Tax=Ylistrum balloti TaxID=509963 RepID=UPI002905A4A0|nr:N(6)-adenine-specific methyltransferase METTL4-like [Ylistrum balloti]
MAVICKSDLGWVVDHKQFLDQTYNFQSNQSSDSVQTSLQFQADLFDIKSPFMMDSQFAAKQDSNIRTTCEMESTMKRKRKRKRKVELNCGELKAAEYHDQIKDQLRLAINTLLEMGKEIGYFPTKQNVQDLDNNVRARSAVKSLGQTNDSLEESCYQYHFPTARNHQGITLQNNDSMTMSSIVNRPVHYHGDDTAFVSLDNERYLLPPRCSFLLSDISHLSLLETSIDFPQFDMIVMDPPWQNKSVKRLKKYYSMSNEDLIDIPVQRLGADNSVVVVWVTNRWQHIQFIKDSLFPRWSVEFLTEWHWVKVTKAGEMVYEFDSPHRKPYEVLIIGRCRKLTVETDTESTEEQSIIQEKETSKIPLNRTILSVPCCIHSVKPPLQEVMKEYLPSNPHCLELFARNLCPDWTSWGNQVLKHQQLKYFDAVT